MKALKYIGIGLLSLIVLLVAVSFLLPRQVQVQRSLVMKAQPQVIYDQINTLRNWEKWSPWHQIDPDMQLSYDGPASGPGASYTWKSNHDQVGNGKLTIISVRPNEQIISEMDFMENGKGSATYELRPVSEGTEVTWIMNADMGNNPIGRYMGLMMDSFVGPDFERGLANLQRIVESPASTPPTPEVSMN